MARQKSKSLTDGELRLMNVLWDKERATVKEVVAALPGAGRPAYSTVLTMLRILEDKGYARHEKRVEPLSTCLFLAVTRRAVQPSSVS